PRAAEEHMRLCTLVAEALAHSASGPSHPGEGQPGVVHPGEGQPTSAPIPVRPAYLELTEPSVASAIDEAVESGATLIRVFPHFLNSGNHVLVDLPAIIEAARVSYPTVDIELATHLGDDPGLIELTASRIARPNRPI
ncbi:MAG TPA: CbiX/SirB N-terminal domain-containing protein, partial [Microthrixaceae bacterium]|nr:CbiX/SirB N-terminal domain-containing protein [Microthrixaceae bacterium]